MADETTRNRPLVIAHRGLASLAPENTMASYRAALASGSDYVECDIRITADDVIVMMHDPSVDRTTNGAGVLREQRYETLQRLDAGGWFSSEYANERIPTFVEVFRLVKGKKRLVVDAKDADIAPRLMEVLAEEGAAREDVVIFSFEWQVIEESRAIHPDWDVAFLDDELTEDAQEREAEVKRVAQIGCTGIGVSVQRVDQAFVTMAQAAGLMVYVYTANHPRHIEKLLQFGVDAIISDRPDGVLELVKE